MISKLLKTLNFLLKKGLSNVEIRSAIHGLTQMLAIKVSMDFRVQVNPNVSTTASRIRDLTRMNPPTFFGSKVEDP